jgi:hypothetical protein
VGVAEGAVRRQWSLGAVGSLRVPPTLLLSLSPCDPRTLCSVVRDACTQWLQAIPTLIRDA